jgi:polysaccharide export outer membrane protein
MKTAMLFCAAAMLSALLSGCSGTGRRSEATGSYANLPANTALRAFPNSGSAPTSITLTNQLRADLLHAPTSLFTLGPGDSVEIEILGTPLSRAIATVGPDGKIYFYLLRGLDVWGLTLDQTRELLEKELAKYLSQPQVTLTLRTVGSKFVWVLGRLNKPGIYPLTGPMTLLECLSLAGGTARSASQVTTADLADLRHSFVMRQGRFLPVNFQRLLREGDTSQNIVLQPDDFVFVPSALEQEVYILGAVVSPRAMPYTEQMTLVSAVAGGNGAVTFNYLASADLGPFMKDAYLSHVAIVRGSLAEPSITIVNYGAIIKGHASDVPLEPGDIVYVPNTPFTTLKRYVDLVVSTFISVEAANEGLRAGGLPAGTGTSIAVPVSTPSSGRP